MIIDHIPPRSIAAIATFQPITPILEGATVFRIAPNRYIATALRDADLAARFAQILAGLAAVTDQSDQWETFALTGPDAGETLARLVPIDLNPDHFPPGAIALTRAAHLDVRLLHCSDGNYELSVTRSYAPDLLHALHQAALGQAGRFPATLAAARVPPSPQPDQ